MHEARRLFRAAFGLQQPSQYVPHASSRLAALDIGYILISTITSGQTLAQSWDEKRDDARLQNLQRDLARVMVSLARVPLPRIGSFRLDNDGYLRLDNRPISVQSTVHENEGLTIGMSRRTTFTSVKEFVLSQLAGYETRFLEQANATADREDAWYQMGALAAAKLTFPQLLRDDLCSGPFVLALTDLHRSNIFVDENWNITSIMDLEFACAWPVEFLHTPHWLEVQFINDVTPAGFAPRHTEFMEHIRREEKLQQGRDPNTESLSSIMQRSWDSGTFWIPIVLMHPVSFSELLSRRILKGYFECPDEDLDNGEVFRFYARLFRRNISGIIDRKLDDHKMYLDGLTQAFANATEDSS